MKKELSHPLIQELERMYVEMVFGVVEIKPSERQKADLLRMWKRSNYYRRLKNAFAKAPDRKEAFLRAQLEKLPREIYKLLRDWTAEFSDGIGGRPSSFTDTERRQIIQEVRTLQKGLKRPTAIDSVARDWQTTPAKIEGLLKHQNRYKDV